VGDSEYALLGQLALGYVGQWFRALKNVPNWMVYTGMGIGSLAIYMLIVSPPIEITHDGKALRQLSAGFVSFLLAARGGAGTAKDAKLAPATDSK
jgi:cyanate permease